MDLKRCFEMNSLFIDLNEGEFGCDLIGNA